MVTFLFSGATLPTIGWGSLDRIQFSSQWVVGDTWTIKGLAPLEGDFTLGAGNLTKGVYRSLLALANRLYVGNGTNLTFSDNSIPTQWEEQFPGAGTIPLLSQYGGQDQVYGLASFQGRLAVLLRRSIQIWVIDADPANFSRAQVLANIGTMAPLSVQSLGDLDVMFLDDSGVRSLRVRDSSLNAFASDLGSPVDSLILDAIAEVDATTACSVVETTTKNYWLALGSTVYVFGYYPISKIAAWSTFTLPFSPTKFAVYEGITYVRGDDNVIYQYGGTTGNEYDDVEVEVQTPWLDDKMPATGKFSQSIEAALMGHWTISCSLNPQEQDFREVVTKGSYTAPNSLKDSVFDTGRIPFEAVGTHFAFKAVSSGTGKAKLSSLILHYNKGEVL